MRTIRTSARSPVAATGAGVRARSAPTVPASIVLVSADADLLRSLTEALPAISIRTAATALALADELLEERPGALVFDLGALDASAVTVLRHIASQFPDVPLVAVGSREDEARVASLISSGLVYRFLHRPVSIARAHALIAAALRRAAGAEPAASHEPHPKRSPWSVSRLALVTVVAAALAAGTWIASHAPPGPAAATTRAPR